MNSPTDAASVAIRWAEAQDEARLVEIDQATWSPLVTPAPEPAAPGVLSSTCGAVGHPGRSNRGQNRRLCVKLSLRVLATNEVARRLYTAAGFETEGVLVDEFLLDGRNVDDHLLARRLDR
jgi:hypothetical protein